MTFTDLAKAHVRTIVPILVGLVITLALKSGVDLHGYAPEITSAVTAVYYSGARLAEHYLSPKFGWLLGVAAAPRYTASAPAKTTTSTGTHSITITADTSQATAALKALTAEAKRTHAAVTKASTAKAKKV